MRVARPQYISVAFDNCAVDSWWFTLLIGLISVWFHFFCDRTVVLATYRFQFLMNELRCIGI